MNLIWYLLLASAASVAFALVVGALNRWPALGAAVVATIVIVAWEYPNLPALVSVAGASVYFLDVLAAAFLLLVLPRLSGFIRDLGFGAWMWLGVGALLAVSLLRGIFENDFGTTLNEFRTYFYPYAAITWAMTLRWNRVMSRDLIERLAFWMGWGLVAVALYHLIKIGFGSTSTFVNSGTGLEQTTRPLVSGQALMLLLSAMICLWFWRVNRRRALLSSAMVFLLVVVVAQQRTVWGVGLAVIAGVFFVGQKRTRGTIAVSLVLSLWAFAIFVSANIFPDLLSQLSGAASDTGTYDARIRSWVNLIQQSIESGAGTVLFGAPMGNGFGRFEGAGRWVTFAPHNWYVSVFLRVGAVGLSFFLLFIAAVLAKSISSKQKVISSALIVAVVVYGWSYSWPWYIAIFLGWACAASSKAALGDASSGKDRTARSLEISGAGVEWEGNRP